MNGFAFDANILIDAFAGHPAARQVLNEAARSGGAWMSRMAWVEVMSKGQPSELKTMRRLLETLFMDEIDQEVAEKAAELRRARPKLKSPDAIILASAQVRGRMLVTRNTRDFPVGTPGVRIPYTL